MYSKTYGYVYNVVALIFAANFIFFFLTLHDKKYKLLFFKYCALLCLINNFPALYVDFIQHYSSDGSSDGFRFYQMPELLFAMAFCTISMYIGLYLAFAKNKNNFIFGVLSLFFVIVGTAGALCNCFGYIFLNDFTHEADDKGARMYVLYTNFFCHFSLIPMTVIIVKMRYVKFNMANTI
jgi:hypothetical protein